MEKRGDNQTEKSISKNLYLVTNLDFNKFSNIKSCDNKGLKYLQFMIFNILFRRCRIYFHE